MYYIFFIAYSFSRRNFLQFDVILFVIPVNYLWKNNIYFSYKIHNLYVGPTLTVNAISIQKRSESGETNRYHTVIVA